MTVNVVIATNPNISDDETRKVMVSSEKEALIRLARNVNVSPLFLVSLAQNVDGHVSSAALKNISLWSYLQTESENDGVCAVGQQMPHEWLKEMYVN